MSFQNVLSSYRTKIETGLRERIERLGPKSPLRDACEYALLNGGKRFRPSLVLMVAEALNYHVDVTSAAVGVELFHTASLIADDLPCMDNDDERRDKPSVHCVYGDAVALLATYALISAGYGCLAESVVAVKRSAHPYAEKSEALGIMALENISFNTGIYGTTGGQYFDLFPSDLTPSFVREVLHKKTVTLFEISFVSGWLFGGGAIDLLDKVKEAAARFGVAFQIADDIGDMERDKSRGHLLNIANVYGREKAVNLFHEEINGFNEMLTLLNVSGGKLRNLSDLLAAEVNERERSSTCRV